MNRTPILLVFALVFAGCGGSQGKLVNPMQDRAAVDDATRVVIVGDEGYAHVGLDGSKRQFLTRGEKYPVSISPDGNMLAISNPDTDLFVRDLRNTAGPREVVSLRGRLSAAAVSPDGKFIAATRHADYSTPQSTWSDQEDNSIDIISTETLEVVKTIEATTEGRAYGSLWFGSSGLLYTAIQGGEAIDPSNGIRKTAAPERADLILLKNQPRSCGGLEVQIRGWHGDEGLEIVDTKGKVEHVVRIEGRERGFHDYLPTIDSFFFVPSCKYVVFEFRDTIFAVDVDTHRVAKLENGTSTFRTPSQVDWDPSVAVDVSKLDTRRVFVTAPTASVCPTKAQATKNECGNSVEFADKGYVRRKGETVTVVGEPVGGLYRAIRYTKAGTLPSWVDASRVASKPAPAAATAFADSRHDAWRVRADAIKVAAEDTVSGGTKPVEPFVFLVERNEKTWALRLPECAARSDDENLRYMLFHGCLMYGDCDTTSYICDEDYCDEIVFSLEAADDFEHDEQSYPSMQIVELVDRMGRFVATDVCE